MARWTKWHVRGKEVATRWNAAEWHRGGKQVDLGGIKVASRSQPQVDVKGHLGGIVSGK